MDYLNLDRISEILKISEEIGSLMSVSDFCNQLLIILKRLIPYDNGHFIFYDPSSNLLPRSYRYNIDETIHQQYLEYYRFIDDFMNSALNTPEPKRSTDIMDYSQWRKTEYFNDFHLKNNFYYIAIADIHYKNRLLSSVSLIRNIRSINFSPTELTYLRVLAPHIANHLHKLQIIERHKKTTADNIIEIITRTEEKYRLTDREHDIINYVIKGKSNAEISDLLYISTDTVKKHLNSIYKKTGVSNRTELLAALLGLV